MSPEAAPGWRYEWSAPTGPGPALLMLHGTGGEERQMIGLGRALAPGAPLLAPRGRVIEGGMARYFSRLPGDPFSFPDLRERTDELAAFVRGATERHAIADRPLVAVGYSNGANAATALMLFHPGLLAGAALLRGMLPAPLPSGLDLTGVRALAANGALDPVIPAAMGAELVAALRAGGAQVQEHRAPAGHELTDGDLDAVARWLERVA